MRTKFSFSSESTTSSFKQKDRKTRLFTFPSKGSGISKGLYEPVILPNGNKAFFFKSQQIHEMDLDYSDICQPIDPHKPDLPTSINVEDNIHIIEPSHNIINTTIPSKSHEYDDFVYEQIIN